ncbi:hypothetical protein Tco_0025241, partial [Tanacetum coccineum]
MKCLEASSLCLMKLIMKKLDDFRDKYQVYGRIVGIKSLFDVVGITAVLLEVTTAR